MSERPDLEARLAADEQRLLRDEERLEVEEQEVQRNRAAAFLGVGLAGVLAVAVTALVLAVLALDDDIDALGRRAAPSGSVSTAALRDGSVTAAKLATGSVGTNALAPSSVFTEQVAPNSLTGADIRESTLHTVPSAVDAERLGGRPAGAFVAAPERFSQSSVTNAERTKGPVTVRCPAGTRVLSGGAEIQGAATGAALVRNAPDGTTGWTATAHVTRTPPPSWRLVVTAICAE